MHMIELKRLRKTVLISFVLALPVTLTLVFGMWSHDPEFHSGPGRAPDHLIWIDGYSVSSKNFMKMTNIFLGVWVILSASYFFTSAVKKTVLRQSKQQDENWK